VFITILTTHALDNLIAMAVCHGITGSTSCLIVWERKECFILAGSFSDQTHERQTIALSTILTTNI
jgi:hypothetical protein